MVGRHRLEKIHDGQRDTRQVCESGQLLPDQDREKQVRDLLYKYKNAFSLRDKIGLCLNIKIEIDVTDKSPFFIRPFHANEEDKVILDREMK